MKYGIRAACASDVGKRRQNNEDNFIFNDVCLNGRGGETGATHSMECVSPEGLYFAVFDGIGGESDGEAASCAAAQKLLDAAGRKKPFYTSDTRFYNDLFAELNAAVLDEGHKLVSERIGTTCALIHLGSRYVNSVNVGDSRIYIWQSGTLQQLSIDDVAARPLPGRRKAPITQHLGMNPMEVKMVPHIKKTELHIGDRYLICSDGLTDMLCDKEIATVLSGSEDAKSAVDMLIAMALENGGRDNVTVIVVDIC